MSDLPVQIILELVNKMTGPAREAAKSLDGITKGLDKIGEEAKKAAGGLDSVASSASKVAAVQAKMHLGVGNVIGGLSRLGVKITAVTALSKGMWIAMAKPAFDVGKQMEDWETKFYQIMKNRQRAKNAVRSMFSLDEQSVDHSWTDFSSAFTKMGALGIIPSRDDLMLMSDTAGLIDVPLDTLAYQIAQASHGSGGAFKRLGMKADTIKPGKKSGKPDMLEISWAGPDGKTQKRSVRKDDAEAIYGVILERLKQSYGGYQQEKSKTWEGQVDSLMDAWHQFLMEVAMGSKDAPMGPFQPGKEPKQQGLFPWVREQIKDLTAWVDAKKKDGSLSEWADYTSQKIIEIAKAVKDVVVAIPEFVKAIRDAVPILKDLDAGGLMKLGVVLWLLPDVATIGLGFVQLATGLAQMRTALAAGGAAGAAGAAAGWGGLFSIAAGITAIAVALMLLDTYKDTFKNFIESWTGTSIATPDTGNIAADYGAISGEATRNWISKNVPGGKSYYKTVDEFFGRAPQPAPGTMGPTRPDPNHSAGAYGKGILGWLTQGWAQRDNKLGTAPDAKGEGVKSFSDLLGRTRSLWETNWGEKKADVNSNIEPTYRALKNLKSLWTDPWGSKQLQIQGPSPGAYTPQLGPASPTPQKQSSLHAPVHVTINAQGADKAAFSRYAKQTAAAVKTAMRGALNDGNVPQSV